MNKYITAFLIFMSLAAPLYSTGSFSTGILLGAAGDGGSVGKVADDVNYSMTRIKASDPDAKIDVVPVYYTPALTVNFRYFYDRLMLQLGWEYAASLFYDESGSIKPSDGEKNKIEIEYSRFTFPLSAGLVIPATRRTRFYMAGGFNVSFVMIEIKQSNPGTFSKLPEKKNSYSSYIPGFQMKFGAEALLSRNYSILFEYTRYMSNSRTVESDSGNSRLTIDMDTFEIAAGINYTVDTGL